MLPDMAASPRPIATADIPWTEWSDVPRFGLRWRHLPLAVGCTGYHVGVAIEELPPGMQSAPAHYHLLEEEHLYILEGALTVRLGAQRHPMQAGDYVCFPAGQRAGHCFINKGTEPFRYLMIGERKAHDVCVYPDSNKLLVRALDCEHDIFDMGATKGYWDGENAGDPLP